MRLVPDDIQNRWFVKLGADGPWQAKTALRQMVAFRRHNLLEALAESPFDLIFLKNVLIYFDGPSKAAVLANIRKVMKPGTMLVAGAAEGISDQIKDLKRFQPWLYARE
jgi:chemotaxis protein methyltransferase CheR